MKKRFWYFKNKLILNKIKITGYMSAYKMNIDIYKYGYLYILLVFLSFLFSLIISIFLNIKFNKDFEVLFTDTGIALIGLSGIIFTLQIFNQETRNSYTNSVMEKILNIRFQHLVEYTYIVLITFLFILIPKINILENNINLFVPFYYLTIINIFVMLGIDLFISTNLSNKFRLIKVIEKRVNYILDIIEKQYMLIEKYSKKINSYNPSLNDYISKGSQIFSCYIKCINSLLRSSIDDPILFENGMEAYIKIIENRLSKRKNRLNHVDIPFFNEILPTTNNDAFIERYMLEYLNEYAQMALNNKNRDILQAIQKTYHQILLLGKDNKYNNDNKLELTVRIIFYYYLEVIKMIVKMNNDNMLFDTVEIFKDLFIKNRSYFYDLIDDSFLEFISESITIALEKKSLMNYRNILEIANIPLNCILINDDPYNYLKIESILRCIKISIIKLTSDSKLIKARDGARLYLQYVFNSADPYSLINYLLAYYKNNIDDEQKYIDCSNKPYEIIKRFIDFYTSKETVTCLKIMDKDNRFVTGFIDYRYTIAMVVKMLICMMSSNQFNFNYKIQNLFIVCFKSIDEMVLRHDSNGIRIRELNDFYKDDLYNSLQDYIKNDEKIQKIYFDNYYASLVFAYDEKCKARKCIEDYYEFINLVFMSCKNESYIDKFLDWYFNFVNIELVNMISVYNEIVSFEPFGDEILSRENKIIIKEKIYKMIEDRIRICSDDELDKVAEIEDVRFLKRCSKRSKIDRILKNIKKEEQ